MAGARARAWGYEGMRAKWQKGKRAKGQRAKGQKGKRAKGKTTNCNFPVFREQIEALITMSDVCEQEIKFEVFSWNALIEYIKHFLSVQVGPFEKCCIWGQIWMVDQPTWWEKGDNLLQTAVRISHLQYYFGGADEESEVCDINHNAGVCNCDMRLYHWKYWMSL